MPCNLYGIGDNFESEKSHVVAALIRTMHEAKLNDSKSVILWGTGKARRELLFNIDLADACLYLFEHYSGNDFFNVGTGFDISIEDLAELIKEIVGYKGKIVFDNTKPDGMPQKLLDTNKLDSLGWKYRTDLRTGILITYQKYVESLLRC
jgi:GDP-L-fucose synthase